MAELTAFSFQPGTSLLHRLDVRFKILFLILTSLISLGDSADRSLSFAAEIRPQGASLFFTFAFADSGSTNAHHARRGID